MCYSAEASFIASGVLIATSVAIARTPKEHGSLPLAAIPAIFATHQFIEGCIWLSQDEPGLGSLETAAITLYVLIAYVLWPIYIPFAAYRMETCPKRRIAILLCQAVGLAVGVNYLVGMIQTPVAVSVYTCNLSYQVASIWNLGPAYLIAVTVPLLISSRKGLVLFGVGVVASCAAGLYLEQMPSFPSVWCFFAAVLSISLLAYFKAAQRQVVSQRQVSASI
ncbi:MAG: hypothetical protein C3F13_18205 [Anaerolineales bacterium]|nr:hypothetical protein [Anaerolineae bacterium]PWB49772.1 MAG: hypothetical protein C3F13_18205 [Anaerolineales bacterium]